MDDKLAALKDSLVEQFKGKARIEDLVEVIDEEFREIFDFFVQLRDERDLYHAVGKQLDGVGDIAVLTRKEAGRLAGDSVPINVIDDDRYRKYLAYKILKNTCNCTYPELIKAYRLFWDKPLYYTEDPNQPATMFLKTGELSIYDHVEDLLHTPIIKPAGVGIHVTATVKFPDMETCIHMGGAFASMQTLPVPEAPDGMKWKSEARFGGVFAAIMTLPVPERK